MQPESYDLFLRHSLAGGIVFLSVALDVENAVDEDFAVSAKRGGCIDLINALRGVELDNVRFPRGADMVVGDESKGLVYDSLFAVDDGTELHRLACTIAGDNEQY